VILVHGRQTTAVNLLAPIDDHLASVVGLENGVARPLLPRSQVNGTEKAKRFRRLHAAGPPGGQNRGHGERAHGR
jgi:hypothetical protein